ncbi:MAG: hypothetical protein AAGD96_07390 [Chloroflexota bacterium]
MQLKISPLHIFKSNLALITILVIIHLINLFLISAMETNFTKAWHNLFSLDGENNVPTAYSALALLVVSIVLFYIYAQRKKLKLPYVAWIILSFIFMFLALDEWLQIHEILIAPFRLTFNTSGALYFAWVIPYGIGLIIFAASYLKFLINLPKKFAMLFIISGLIYCAGALGLELVSGVIVEEYGMRSLATVILNVIEETLEMVGIATFIYALLDYIVYQFDSQIFQLSSKNFKITLQDQRVQLMDKAVQ